MASLICSCFPDARIVAGVDMAAPLGNRLYEELHDAPVRHQAIFFRDQDITPARRAAPTDGHRPD